MDDLLLTLAVEGAGVGGLPLGREVLAEGGCGVGRAVGTMVVHEEKWLD